MMTIEEIQRENDVPVVIADHDGFITYVNDRFQAVFGWKQQEIIGKTLTTIIPANLRPAHHLGFSRFLTTGKPTLLNLPLKLKALTKDDRVFDAEHIIIAEQRDGRWFFGAVIRPLDEQ